MKKRILSVILTVVMVMTMLPVATTTATATEASGTCGADGDNLTWTLSNGVLTISGEGEMEGSPWSDYVDEVVTVVIENGVTSIGASAFYHCTSIESVTIPDSVTSIAYRAFWGCESLKSIFIPANVTEIGELILGYCCSLTDIYVDESNTEFSSEDGVLFDNDMTTIIACPNGKEGSYTIPDGVTCIGEDAFFYCEKLSEIIIPASVVNIERGAFSFCTSVENIIIPAGVLSIRSICFWCCDNLSSVSIPNTVTTISESAFHGCSKLTSITIPDSITIIGSGAFGSCYNLETIYFEGDAPVFDNSPNDIFYDVTATAYYPAGNDTWTEDVIQDYGGSITWVAYDVNSDDSGDAVASGACGDNLTWSYNGTTITISGTGDMYDFSDGTAPWASYSDSALTIVIEEGVTSIGEYAFEDCTNIMFVTIADSVTSIGDYAFCGCENLISIVSIGNEVTSIGDYAFYGCTGLSSVCYNGTEDEWNKISIGSNNSCLTNATIFFKETETGTDDEIDYSSFNASIYQANKIISGFGGLYAFDYELDQETTSELIVYYSEENNTDDLIALWESFSMAIDTMDDITNIADLYLHVDEVDIYSALILDSLEESTSGDFSFSSYQNAVKILKTMLSDLSTLLKTSYEIDTTDFKGYDLTGEDAEALEKDISKWFDEKYPGFSYTSDLLKIISNGFKIMGNISDYIDYAASCITLMQVSKSMEEVLQLAYEKRSSTNGATDAMAIALKMCLNMITDSTEECIAAILDGVLAMAGYDSIKWIIKEGMWKGITSYLKVAFPELYFLKVAYSAGKTISNALFSTDDTAEQYIKLRYLVWLENLINSVYDDVEKEFISGQTEEQAEIYLSALWLVFKLRDADYEEAYKYVDILETSTWEKLFGTTDYETIKSSIETLRNSYNLMYEIAETAWVYYLEDDYPDFESYEALREEFEELMKAAEGKRHYIAKLRLTAL